MNSSTSTNTDLPSVPPDFPSILNDLNRAILRAQPTDILEFCAEYFRLKTMDHQGTAEFTWLCWYFCYY